MERGNPLLLVDVDGVLNPFAAEACPEGFREYDFFAPGSEQMVRLSGSHGQWLRDLSAKFDLIWATGWGHEAGRLISPVLGLPRFPTIVFPPSPFDPSWKLPTIEAFVGEQPLAWIDDILSPTVQAWAAQRTAPTLLIAIDPAIGLTFKAVEQLHAWADRLR
ncbi:MAG: hypothetical protein ACRD0K_23540 [Egibacteraceae bacterium]